MTSSYVTGLGQDIMICYRSGSRHHDMLQVWVKTSSYVTGLGQDIIICYRSGS